MAISTAESAQNEGPLILAVGWILVGVPGFLVGLRLYSKAVLARGFGWDDAVCAFSWVRSNCIQPLSSTTNFQFLLGVTSCLYSTGHEGCPNGCCWKTCRGNWESSRGLSWPEACIHRLRDHYLWMCICQELVCDHPSAHRDETMA